MRVSELREVCLAAFEERCMVPEGSSGKATEVGRNEEQPPEGPDGGDLRIELHATGSGGAPGVRHVDENSLVQMATDADRVTVLSAYYVRDVLGKIAGTCRGEVRIVLNGLGGRRLTDQAKDLESLQKTLRKQSRSVEIRLAFAKGVFHTKMYVFETGPDAVAWIGSANATRAGLKGRNEEVLVRMSPVPRSVSAYVESAWRRARPVECCPEVVNSLTAFFRTGVLYYKPYATLQMTVNPFRKAIGNLGDKEKGKLSRFQSDFAEPDVGIGAFSLKRMFQGAEQDSGESPVKRQRVELRRRAVETCYGYWVAEPLIAEVDEMRDKASADKRRWLEQFRGWMGASRDDIVREYALYLQDASRTINEQGVKWPESEARAFEDTSPIERRVDSLLEEFRTARRMERHHQEFVHSEVPEIWEDDAPRGHFSPRSHWLTRPVVTLRWHANTAWLACSRGRSARMSSGVISLTVVRHVSSNARIVRFDMTPASAKPSAASCTDASTSLSKPTTKLAALPSLWMQATNSLERLKPSTSPGAG